MIEFWWDFENKMQTEKNDLLALIKHSHPSERTVSQYSVFIKDWVWSRKNKINF